MNWNQESCSKFKNISNLEKIWVVICLNIIININTKYLHINLHKIELCIVLLFCIVSILNANIYYP